MIAGLIATAMLVIVLGAAVRRSRRRGIELNAALDRALAERLGAALVSSDGQVTIAGGSLRLPRQRLLALVRRGLDARTVAAAAGEALRQPLRPLVGPLSLKVHGPSIALHLVDPLVLELGAGESRLARTPLVDLGLSATYRVDGRPDQCVTEDHLRELAIDTRDVHGIALAVLRQHLDAELVTRALAGERQTLQSTDGRAAAALLVVSGFIPAGARLAATLSAPDRLTLEPWTEGAVPVNPGAGPRQSRGEGGTRLMIDHGGYEIL
jgi:hypothetical protein